MGGVDVGGVDVGGVEVSGVLDGTPVPVGADEPESGDAAVPPVPPELLCGGSFRSGTAPTD